MPVVPQAAELGQPLDVAEHMGGNGRGQVACAQQEVRCKRAEHLARAASNDQATWRAAKAKHVRTVVYITWQPTCSSALRHGILRMRRSSQTWCTCARPGECIVMGETVDGAWGQCSRIAAPKKSGHPNVVLVVLHPLLSSSGHMHARKKNSSVRGACERVNGVSGTCLGHNARQ